MNNLFDLFPGNITDLIKESFKVFDLLQTEKRKIRLGFSGGKDSHALLAVYLAWRAYSQSDLDVEVVFADTGLESQKLLDLILRVQTFCKSVNVKFSIFKPDETKSYWYIQFALGYPVPNRINRWCTKALKTLLMNKKGFLSLTGRHLGESRDRDKKINLCNSGECGIDLVKESIDPISQWRNCNVWDFLGFVDGLFLPTGTIDELLKIYKVDMDENGSSRMGCAHCPVVAKKNIERQVDQGIVPSVALRLREISDKLIQAPRILSPTKAGVLGAISYDARLIAWAEVLEISLELKDAGWLTDNQVLIVSTALQEKSYPPSYKKEWIERQEPFAVSWQDWQAQKKLPIAKTLDSFQFSLFA